MKVRASKQESSLLLLCRVRVTWVKPTGQSRFQFSFFTFPFSILTLPLSVGTKKIIEIRFCSSAIDYSKSVMALEGMSSLENANIFFPKSFSEAPI